MPRNAVHIQIYASVLNAVEIFMKQHKQMTTQTVYVDGFWQAGCMKSTTNVVI
jgi:hypothetical protein